MQHPYTIEIDLFKGPFDLLLFFIERDELDIHDIPIAQITNDFLSYIRKLEELNIDIASEFILVAATLMRIKARILIPRKSLDEEGNEIDPREELVQKLLEYKKFKAVLDEFSSLESERKQMHLRGNSKPELMQIANKALIDLELESLTTYKLMKAFENVMKKYEHFQRRSRHEIFIYKYQVKDQQQFILATLQNQNKLDFYTVFGKLENRLHAIVTFLALLELINNHVVNILQGEGVNNFWLHKKADVANSIK